jgi:hypothetical protein
MSKFNVGDIVATAWNHKGLKVIGFENENNTRVVLKDIVTGTTYSWLNESDLRLLTLKEISEAIAQRMLK